MGFFLHKVYRLMSEKGLSYGEACKETGRHGAAKRKFMLERKKRSFSSQFHELGWCPQKAAERHEFSNTKTDISSAKAESKERRFEQSFLHFN